MSHWVSQTSPWVASNASAAAPSASADHHSRNSKQALNARQTLLTRTNSHPPGAMPDQTRTGQHEPDEHSTLGASRRHALFASGSPGGNIAAALAVRAIR